MLKAETSRTSRTRAGVAITGFALPVVVGLSLTFVGPAAADVTNKQSSTAAQAQSAPSNVMSLRGSTTPPIGKSRSRPALVGSAAVRSGAPGGAAGVTADRWSGPAPAGLTEDRVPHSLMASRWSDPAPAGLTEDRVPHNLTASRWSGPAPAGLTEDRVPHNLTASRWSGPAPAWCDGRSRACWCARRRDGKAGRSYDGLSCAGRSSCSDQRRRPHGHADPIVDDGGRSFGGHGVAEVKCCSCRTTQGAARRRCPSAVIRAPPAAAFVIFLSCHGSMNASVYQAGVVRAADRLIDFGR